MSQQVGRSTLGSLDRTSVIQGWLDRLQAGEASARDELLGHSCDRLRSLTAKMLGGFQRVRRWDETDDVLQNSMMRLYRALGDVTPKTVEEFFGLAALQIRRELIDLARHYYGPLGKGARHATKIKGNGSTVGSHIFLDQGAGPKTRVEWVEFHTKIDELPEREREVFDLYYYQELTQEEISNLLAVSVRTVKRRIRSAKLKLYELLGQSDPAEEE